jgi:hypothetical protein
LLGLLLLLQLLLEQLNAYSLVITVTPCRFARTLRVATVISMLGFGCFGCVHSMRKLLWPLLYGALV